MRKRTIELSFFIVGCICTTLCLAWVATQQELSQVVLAQSIPQGCAASTNEQVPCGIYCPYGSSKMAATSFTGNGLFGSWTVQADCTPSEETCRETTVQLAYNGWCCDRDGDQSANSMCAMGTTDCDDDDPQRKPGLTETCDNKDNDCDNIVDEGFNEDNDGYTTCQGDCNDSNAAINPGATEVCDGLDNDCDGIINEGGVCCSSGDPECIDLGFGCGSFVDYGHGGGCKPASCWDCYANGGQHCYQNGFCETPILIDVNGNGLNMTDAQNGVLFDGGNTGNPTRRAWTAAGSDDSWLALDRNGNGTIDNGTELFGCVTPQPTPPVGEIGNGFIALAEFDKPENGGNGDNQIDFRDEVFSRLKLWRDIDHNGVSRTVELKRLSVSDIQVIELRYHESKRQDEHGNLFKYRAKVRDKKGTKVGRWAWDVFPKVIP